MGELSFLLDTHTLLWWWSEPALLSDAVRSILEDPENKVAVSAASVWEISTKYRIGKLPQGEVILEQWQSRLDEDGFSKMPIGHRHSLLAGKLEGDHRDPFDRMLAAQAIIENIPLLSKDRGLDCFSVRRIWNKC